MGRRWGGRWHVPAACLAVALWLTGCASGGGTAAGSAAEYGADTAEGAVTGFLEAARGDDYRTMMNLFGTAEGPAPERMERSELEQRMFILASLLEHRSAELSRSNLPVGQGRVRIHADLTASRRGDVTVPFIVTSWNDRWLVEQILTDNLTGS